MVSLNLERINSNSPYAVTALRDSMCFRFVTDFGVIYYVSFLEDELMLSDESYQFIIEEFYKLKYCSTVVYMVPRA